MTTSAFTATPRNTDDATFRAWAQAIHNAITGMGWVDTAATGEVNLSTMTVPSVNTYAGYKVYRMNDSLQATYPCFLKFEPGTGTGSTNMQCRWTIGTAHDGSGSLTGTQVFGPQIMHEGNSTSALQCWASGTTSRFSLAWVCDNTGATYSAAFSVERTVDTDGVENGDGIVVAMAGVGGNANIYRVAVIPPSGGVPNPEKRWIIPFSLNTVGASTFNSKEGMGLLVPFMGPALRPVFSWGAMNTTDIPTYGSDISVTVYGASHTYRSIGSGQKINAVLDGSTAVVNNPLRLLMLYE